jgi:hypothetical protein
MKDRSNATRRDRANPAFDRACCRHRDRSRQHGTDTLEMNLRSQMRKLGLFAVGGLVIGWGGFMLLMAPTDGIPAPLLWLGAVIAVAFTLAAAALLYFRARR